MNEATGCCRWRTVIGLAAFAIVACSLPAFGAMNAITSDNGAGTSGDDGGFVPWNAAKHPSTYITDNVWTGDPLPGGVPLVQEGAGCTGVICDPGFVCDPLDGLCYPIYPCHPLWSGSCTQYSGATSIFFENEPSCLLDAEDTWNGGCNTTIGAVFQHLPCDVTVCGEVWVRAGASRDTDWYIIDVTPGNHRLEISVTSDLDFVFGTLEFAGGDPPAIGSNPNASCGQLTGYISPAVTVDYCATGGTLSICMPTGEAWLFAGPLFGQSITADYQCYKYEMTILCTEPGCSEACCYPNATCDDLSEPQCRDVDDLGQPQTTSGSPQGTGTLCATTDCSLGCVNAVLKACGDDFEFNNCTVWDVPNNNCIEGDETPLNPFPTCAAGANHIGAAWWSFFATGQSVAITTCNSSARGVGSPPGGGDSIINLFSGDCDGGNVTEIACGEDDCGPGTDVWLSDICVGGLIVNDEYWFQVAAWDLTSRGNYRIQIICPCPAMAPGPCCLPNGSCDVLSPDDCQNQGGTYQGPFDPGANPPVTCEDIDTDGTPDICNQGACCFRNGACARITEFACSVQPTATNFIPGAFCTGGPGITENPCDGACCRRNFSGLTCISPDSGGRSTEEWCLAQSGTQKVWYEDEGCLVAPGTPGEFFECPDQICPMAPGTPAVPDPTKCQSPAMGVSDDVPYPGGVTAGLSDSNPFEANQGTPNPGFKRADDFMADATGNITEVCWWGQYNDIATNGGGGPNPEEECVVNDDFTITYYADNDGLPGAVVGGPFTGAGLTNFDRTYAGERTPDSPIDPNDVPTMVWSYHAQHAAVAVTSGQCYWIEIINNTDDGSGTISCVWYWETSPFTEGNGFSIAHANVLENYVANRQDWRGYDLSFCLSLVNSPCDRCSDICNNPPASDPEGEVDCFDGYIDTFNSGCNERPEPPTPPLAFTPIECGQTICGTSGYYSGKRGCDLNVDCDPGETCHTSGFCSGIPGNVWDDVRDTDWYKFTLTEQTYVEWCITGEMPVTGGILNSFGVDDCPSNIGFVALSVNPACQGDCDFVTLGAGTWFGFAAVSTGYTTVPCGSTYKVTLKCPTTPTDCTATGARSCRNHGGTPCCLDVFAGSNVEPRLGGVQQLEIDVDDAAGFSGGVTVSCEDNSANVTDESGRVAGTSTAGNTVTVNFSPALPNETTCTVTLDCNASVCVRSVEGDVDRDGTTTTGDASIIKPRFNQSAAAAGCEFDFNVDGTVTTSDFSQVKPTFNNTAPACP